MVSWSVEDGELEVDGWWVLVEWKMVSLKGLFANSCAAGEDEG